MNEITITPFTYPSGEKAFKVQGIVDGKRRRKFPTTELEAVTLKQNWEREILNLEPVPMVATRLTASQVREAEAAFHTLEGRGFTMTEAVRYALLNYRPTDKRVTVQTAYDAFIAEKKSANKRERTVGNYEQRLSLLLEQHGKSLVSEVATDQLRLLIDRDGSSPVNRRNDRVALGTFFKWCLLNEYCATSPVAKIAKIELDDSEPEALPLAECRRLVETALTFKGGKLVPYVVLALFCAIRPKELARITTWEPIDLINGFVKIGAGMAKKRGRRLVKIPDNALHLLRTHKPEDEATPIVGPNWRKDFDKLRELAGITNWPPDVMRHTGISMHLAKHGSDSLTAAWAGNSEDVIHNSYKVLMMPQDVGAFYAIGLPPANVIDLKARAA